MSPITPYTIKVTVGSTIFRDNTKLTVSYLNGIDPTRPNEQINGLNTPCDITISVVDMRTYPTKNYWIILGRIIDMDMDKEKVELLNTIQSFYYPRDSFSLTSVADMP